MSGVGEASLVLGMVSAIISIIDATKQVYEAVEDEMGLPKNFKKSATKLPLISKLLEDAERYISNATDGSIKPAFTPTLEDCKVQATHLHDLFEKVMPEQGDSRWDRYVKAARTIGKGGRIESLIGRILDDLQLLTTRFPEVTTPRGKEQLAKAIEEVTKMEPSLPDGFEQMPVYAHYGSGAQNNNTGSGTQNNNNSTGNQNNGPGQQYIGTNHIVQNYTLNKNATVDDIDRACLRFLRCPDTLAVKNQLKESKDKLLHKSIDWILRNPQYISWKDRDDVCLLWIKGGAGKGKTMISIGLIEQLSLLNDTSTVVTYFFCQNANYELNTLEAIIKGLILRLVNQQNELKESLRRRWDIENERFTEDVNSWRTLWNIFLEMLEYCKCQRVYVIVDALDECQDDGMADLLKHLVRTGLDRPSKIKWLLTSRPLDSAERELLVGSEQVLVSLELNSKHISEAVTTYIIEKVVELDRRYKYGPELSRKIQNELSEKAEDTYLWVSLVCKRLESVHRDEALTTIQDLPPGLHPFYNRVFNQLSKGESAVVKGCIRLLKVVLLAYRPLNIAEVGSVSGLSDEWVTIEVLVDRCASFLKMPGNNIEFVHQSARDYLTGKNGQSILDSYEHYGHGEIALNCLSYLAERLKVNLAHLPQPNSTWESMEWNSLVASMEYAATFWVQHLEGAKQTVLMQNALTEQGEVGTFLHNRFLEWLECLSLLDKLPHAIEALKTLVDTANLKKDPFLSMHIQDATRFLLRHFPTIAIWPLQIYSSAIVFSPQTSVVRRDNLDKIPTWLTKLPQMEDAWASLIQTLAGHSGAVHAVAFSPDGKQIASASFDETTKLWDAKTGDFQKTLAGHSGVVHAVAFSPDGKQIVSASFDETIKLWDAKTGDLQKTLAGHSDMVNAIAFSPDGKQIASASYNNIKLWDAKTGDTLKTFEGHLDWVNSVAFSPDGKQIVSGSWDKTIKLWDIKTNDFQKKIASYSDRIRTIVFSFDGKQIASASDDGTIKLWDTKTGDILKTFEIWSLSDAIVFSPDGKKIASASKYGKTSLSDTKTGKFIREFKSSYSYHPNPTTAIAFSPDSKQIVLGFENGTINLWDVKISNVLKTFRGHSDSVKAITFSPDGKQIASSSDTTIKLWYPKSLKISKFIGSTLDNYLKFRAHQKIKTPEPVWSLKFSTDGQYLVTNLGDIKVENILTNKQSLDFEPSKNIWIRDRWVYYGPVPVLLLPIDFEPQCYDVREDQVTIGLGNGRVINFDIDRISFNSIYKNSR